MPVGKRAPEVPVGKRAPVAVGKGKGTPEPVPIGGKLGRSEGVGRLSLLLPPPKRASRKSPKDGADVC